MQIEVEEVDANALHCIQGLAGKTRTVLERLSWRCFQVHLSKSNQDVGNICWNSEVNMWKAQEELSVIGIAL